MQAYAEHIGVHHTSVRQALIQPTPKVQRSIARHIGVPLHKLWPKWYDKNGKRITTKVANNATIGKAKASTRKQSLSSRESVRGAA